MRSRVLGALVAAAIVAGLMLAPSVLRADASGVGVQAQWVAVPIVNYGDPDGGSHVGRYARPMPVYGLLVWVPLPELWSHPAAHRLNTSPQRMISTQRTRFEVHRGVAK